jgi:DNA-directed RNA polymerase subunit RPC12/RpoP
MVVIYKCPKCKKQYRLYSLIQEEPEIVDFLCYKCENPKEFIYYNK